MARYTGPVCKLCRREETKLYLKGEKCYTDKCPFERRSYPPGQHGKQATGGAGRLTTRRSYVLKQQTRRIYGFWSPRLRRYVELAQSSKGLTGEVLIITLERRLDNVVYRLGLADPRAAARQLVQMVTSTVNGRMTDIPSYLVKAEDVIGVRPGRAAAPSSSVSAAISSTARGACVAEPGRRGAFGAGDGTADASRDRRPRRRAGDR